MRRIAAYDYVKTGSWYRPKDVLGEFPGERPVYLESRLRLSEHAAPGDKWIGCGLNFFNPRPLPGRRRRPG